FTAVYSRHCFVWLTFRQTTGDVIEGFEAAWRFFGGVFAVVIPDNMKPIVERADALEPRLNQAFVEYAQARGFVVDPARVRAPTPPTFPPTRRPTRCATSSISSGWPPPTAVPSGLTRRPCWTVRCRGPRCARSTPCWAWSSGGDHSGSKPPAGERWTPKRSAS